MSLAVALLIIFAVFLLLAIIFVGMPQTKSIKWNEEREAVMYKSGFWSIIIAAIALVLSLISFAKGY